MSPKVSVIIPTFDRAPLLRRALLSVAAQTLDALEVIIVDDGSTDDSAKVVDEFDGAGWKYFWQENRGVSAARNRGIYAAQAEWIALLDSDDEWAPEKLAQQLAFHDRHPQLKVSQSEELWLRDGEPLRPQAKHKKRAGWIFAELLKICLISPSAVFIHRSVFDRVGFFDEQLPACEDYELWLRIALRYEIGLLPEVLVTKHGGHDDQLSYRMMLESGLDRYRIQSLLNIRDSQVIPGDWRQALNRELERKLTIFMKGLIKRQKDDEFHEYQRILDEVKRERHEEDQ